MASSDNLRGLLDPWASRPIPFADSWISEAFARDTETLSKALHMSLSSDHSDAVVSPTYDDGNLLKTGAVSQSVSGSDVEPPPEPKRAGSIPANGKPTKRKSRASKRRTTTVITADPANFRQMVQQVTGARFVGGSTPPVAPVLKPEPQRAVSRIQGCLPTLDTSAFLLDLHLPREAVPQSLAVPPSGLVADSGSGLDFNSFSSFPTLESWKVM